MLSNSSKWNDSEYLYETDKKGITFMPLKVDKLSNHLFKYADKVILMSATIIDPKNFCKSLGIKKFYLSNNLLGTKEMLKLITILF